MERTKVRRQKNLGRTPCHLWTSRGNEVGEKPRESCVTEAKWSVQGLLEPSVANYAALCFKVCVLVILQMKQKKFALSLRESYSSFILVELIRLN